MAASGSVQNNFNNIILNGLVQFFKDIGYDRTYAALLDSWKNAGIQPRLSFASEFKRMFPQVPAGGSTQQTINSIADFMQTNRYVAAAVVLRSELAGTGTKEVMAQCFTTLFSHVIEAIPLSLAPGNMLEMKWAEDHLDGIQVKRGQKPGASWNVKQLTRRTLEEGDLIRFHFPPNIKFQNTGSALKNRQDPRSPVDFQTPLWVANLEIWLDLPISNKGIWGNESSEFLFIDDDMWRNLVLACEIKAGQTITFWEYKENGYLHMSVY